ncbi:hypothetical protein [Rhodanobacter sp. 115]|uniref:hypothetical protein n=1 Tax=Rhodanobacter sp. FW021-MT20 TaxID=1162282 RepID=UPI0012F7D645|nr:hypothetical protein [Rhodanobacter sp. 115]
MFADNIWVLLHCVAGQRPRHGTINWNISLPDGSSLTDEKNSSLLTEFKALVWTMIHDPREGKAITGGTLNSLELAIASVCSWMILEEVPSIADVDSAMSWVYAQYFLDHHEQVDPKKQKTRPRTVSNASASVRLTVLVYMYRQRQALRLLGIEPAQEAPYDGRSVDDVVRNELDLHRKGKLDPIPDDIAIPILGSAIRFLGAPADDVMALQDLCMRASKRHRASRRGHGVDAKSTVLQSTSSQSFSSHELMKRSSRGAAHSNLRHDHFATGGWGCWKGISSCVA